MTASKSDLLRDKINKALDESFDFSTKLKRREFWYDFCELHSEIFDKDRDRTLLIKMLQDCLKKRGIDPRTYGLKRQKIPRFHQDMKATITPKPQLERPEPELQYTSPQPQATEQEQTQDNLREEAKKAAIIWNEKNVGITIKAMYAFLKFKWEYLEELTDDEKETFGELWLPAFERWLTNDYSIIIFPLLATGGILSPKIKKARQKARAEKQKEKG